MIISPPFLPTRTSGQTEADWLDAAMNGWQPGSGSFPITGDSELWKGNHLLDWHGGLHLKAPIEDGRPLPVRAIADGTVVFVRKPTAVDIHDQNHPLNYGGGTTSDGVVVIRHDTEIGVDANDQPVEVRFYSVYVHLGSIEAKVQQGKPIYRKDMIGMAGHVYGDPNTIHFEVRCDDDNLRKLIGRSSDPLDTNAEGRSDVIFGEIYFKLPTGTSVYAEEPAANSAVATSKPRPVSHQKVHGHHAAAEPNGQPGAAMSPSYTTTEDLIVGLRYLHQAEDGGLHAGDAVLRTYTLKGDALVGKAANGAAITFVREAEGEYGLYQRATAIAGAFPSHAQPIPGAVYELLRFGRVIGPDALQSQNVPHWRKVVYPNGEGWVNLNAPSVRKFSDADFPPWAGWTLINDDTDSDSRCDSAKLAKIVHGTAAAASLTVDQTKAQIQTGLVQDTLRTTVCKIPSEWDTSTLDVRWGWLKTASDTNTEPMTAEEYVDFKAHGQALCFSAPELFGAQWSLCGYSFISAWRNCGWLSHHEFAQCFAPQLMYLHGASFVSTGPISWSVASERSATWGLVFNLAMRRYGLSNSRGRTRYLLAQMVPETANLHLLVEGGGEGASYAPYYGRGFIQLTHLETYQTYGQFRGFPKNLTTGKFGQLGWSPDDLIAKTNRIYNSSNCADSAGYFAISKSDMLSHLDGPLSQDNVVVVSRDINGKVAIENLNGLDLRLEASFYMDWILGDSPPPKAPFRITFDWRRNSSKEPVLDEQGRPVIVGGKVKKKFYKKTQSLDLPPTLQRKP